VQSTGNLIGIMIKFSAGVENCHDDFNGGLLFAFMHINRNSTAIIPDCNTVVKMNCNINFACVTCKSFINTVINCFIYQMVETTRACISDIHTWAHSNSFKSFQDCYSVSIIFTVSFYFFRDIFFFIRHLFKPLK